MYNSIEETIFDDRCAAFRRIVRKKQALDIVQIILDILLIGSTFLPLLSSRTMLPFIAEAVLLVKLLTYFLGFNTLQNIIAILINIVFAVLCVRFKLTDHGFVTPLSVSFAVHILRIKSCYIDSKLRKLYGYPEFNPFFMKMEAEKNSKLKESLDNEYRQLIENSAVKFEVFEISKAYAQPVKLAGIVCMVLGLCMLSSGISEMQAYNNARSVVSLENCRVGELIKGEVSVIYRMTGESFQDIVDDEYLCEFGNEAVIFSVSNSYKSDFGSLYDHYFKESPLNFNAAYGNGSAVAFRGRIVPAEKYEGDFDYNVSIMHLKQYDNFNEDIFIQLIDPDKAEKTMNHGIVLAAAGAVILTALMLYLVHLQRN